MGLSTSSTARAQHHGMARADPALLGQPSYTIIETGIKRSDWTFQSPVLLATQAPGSASPPLCHCQEQLAFLSPPGPRVGAKASGWHAPAAPQRVPRRVKDTEQCPSPGNPSERAVPRRTPRQHATLASAFGSLSPKPTYVCRSRCDQAPAPQAALLCCQGRGCQLSRSHECHTAEAAPRTWGSDSTLPCPQEKKSRRRKFAQGYLC